DPASREALIKAVSDPEGVVRVQACRALGRVGQPEDSTILARVMTVDNLEDCRIAAIEGLGDLKAKDVRILQVLVAGMEHDDPATRRAAVKSRRTTPGMAGGVAPAAWSEAVLPKEAATPAPAPAPATANAAPAPRR